MSLLITGLSPEPFRPLFALSNAELAAAGIVRRTVDAKPGFPCRITLEDAEPGETVLLLAYEHQPAASPYRAGGPIFVREAAAERARAAGTVPEYLASRLLSVRAYDDAGMMVEAEVVDGRELEPLAGRFLARPDVAYLHVHFARRGCYAARIDRA